MSWRASGPRSTLSTTKSMIIFWGRPGSLLTLLSQKGQILSFLGSPRILWSRRTVKQEESWVKGVNSIATTGLLGLIGIHIGCLLRDRWPIMEEGRDIKGQGPRWLKILEEEEWGRRGSLSRLGLVKMRRYRLRELKGRSRRVVGLWEAFLRR